MAEKGNDAASGSEIGVARLAVEHSCEGPFTATAEQHVEAGRAYTEQEGCFWWGRWYCKTRYFAVGSDEDLGKHATATVTLFENLSHATQPYFTQTDCRDACVPEDEICDGADNDCDCQADEGGVCCVPETETCDGADNDCDGLVDEDGVCDAGDCTSFTATVAEHAGAGRAYAEREGCFWWGRWYCKTTRYFAVGSDEDLGTDPDASVTLREDPPGFFFVDSECPLPPECARAETCENGVDDDCDGQVDNSLLCQDPPLAAAIDEVITRCPSAATLDAIDADLDIRFEYTGDLSGEGYVCTAAEGSRDLTHFQERVYQALIALRVIGFDEPVEWTDLPLYEWLVRTIDGIRLRTDIANSFCCTPPADGEGAYYINLLATPDSSALFTDLWATLAGQGLNSLVQLMVHEVRHADGPQDEFGTIPRPHTCGSNDNTIDELGSWGTVYHYFRNLVFNTDPCFLRPTLASSPEFPQQLFGADDYLEAARDRAYSVQTTRFCEETSVPPDPPEPVPTCTVAPLPPDS